MNTLKLVEFKTTDNLHLPGLLYKPRRKTKKVLIMLHGNGSTSVFYSAPRTNQFAKILNQAGIAYFPFNNRGAHYIKKLKVIKRGQEDRTKQGMVYEKIKDCIKDIDGAISFLSKQGYREFYLVGYSTGANKICVYNYYKPSNKVAKYILVGGGDDTGIYYNLLGKKKFAAALQQAKREIKKGNGTKLVPAKLLDFPFSWQSLYDTINPDGDYNTFPFYEAMKSLKLSKKKLFRHYRSIKKPTLVVYGSQDEYCYDDVSGVMKLLKKQTGAPDEFMFKIFQGADHGLHGQELRLARLTAKWLNS